MTAVKTGITELSLIVDKSGLPAAVAASLVETFIPLAERAAARMAEADAIIVNDATQVTEMRQARAVRLKLREVRIEVENSRKELKEESLRRGQAIDAVAKYLKDSIEPVEKRLDDAEKFAERREAERKAALKLARELELRPLGVDPVFYDLGNMPEAAYTALLTQSRKAHDDRIEAERKAERERAEAEAARKAEEERVRAENARLREEAVVREKAAAAERARLEAEASAKEAQAKAERDRIEAEARKRREADEKRLKAEREAREKAEAEVRRQREADEKRKADEKRARHAADRAPDADKIRAYAVAVRSLPLPTAKSEAAAAKVADIASKAESFARWIEQRADELTQ